MRHGNGIAYFRYNKYEDDLDDDEYSYKLYEGEFRNGLYHGKGTLYYDNEIKYNEIQYKGDFKDGKPYGYGKMYNRHKNFLKSNVFAIKYYDSLDIVHTFFNKKDVSGKEFRIYMIYEGELQNGLYHGYGKIYFETYELNGDETTISSQEYFENKMKYCKTDRIRYEGEFKEGIIYGKFYFNNRMICEDEFNIDAILIKKDITLLL